MTTHTGSGVTGASEHSTIFRVLPRRAVGLFLVLGLLIIALAACGGDDDAASAEPLYIGGIPDQDLSVLEARFEGVAEYLSNTTDLDVRYVPSTDYAALVTAFGNGDVQLGWFGGLTGVQARLAVEGAEAVAQRPVDQEFESVFIVGTDVAAEELGDLAGSSFTFGSESSTSGHLMPRYFLTEAGVDPDTDFSGGPGYSGSHDKTWQLVESGAYEAGALNRTVWDGAVEEGAVDESKVTVLEVSPPYFDYHWVIHPGIDDQYGEGTSASIVAALLAIGEDPDAAETLDLFDATGFIATDNANYGAIEDVARGLGLIADQ